VGHPVLFLAEVEIVNVKLKLDVVAFVCSRFSAFLHSDISVPLIA